MIRFTSGDVLQAREAYLAHGVAEGNQEGLGTGLALKLSTKWPDVQKAFKRHARSGRFKGGSIFVVAPAEGRPGVVYLATQADMYRANLPYLRRALRALVRWADDEAVPSVALPKVGAGLGKLSWTDDVRPLFEELFTPAACMYVIYEEFTLADEAT